MPRYPFQDRRILITGASSGIGQALARQLATKGARVATTARRGDRLARLSQDLTRLGATNVHLAGDITDATHRASLVQLVVDRWGGLDCLINNAGVGAIGDFAQDTSDRLRYIMEVNFFAPVELIREVLPVTRAGHHPMLVNIGSVLGHRAVKSKSEYCASKFALHGFSDALRAELASEGIHVLLVSPSTTKSEFFDNVLAGADTSPRTRGMSPETVARKTIRAMESGRHEIILSSGGKLLVWLDRFAPSLADRILARW